MNKQRAAGSSQAAVASCAAPRAERRRILYSASTAPRTPAFTLIQRKAAPLSKARS
jgi:hypothetical protein